jgi:hypothetical protein
MSMHAVSEIYAVLSNGVLYIERDGKRFNVLGVAVQ